jgi:hypothetical protein
MDAQVRGWLFVLAIANVERGAIAVLGKGHNAVQAYQSAVPDATDVRNMVTHFDEYIKGAGRLQESGAVEGFNVFLQNDGRSLTLHVAGRSLRVAEAYASAANLASAALEALESESAQVSVEFLDAVVDEGDESAYYKGRRDL